MIDSRRSAVRLRTCPGGNVCGFSLIEVVIVIVLIAVITAIAVPRLSKGSQGSADAATVQNTAVLQKALDLYAAEHGGTFPKEDRITDQLTLYTDAAGSVSKQKAPPYQFGPYVRKVPAIPLGPNKGCTRIAATPGAGVAWLYNAQEGAITANLSNDASSTTGNPSLLNTSPAGTIVTTTPSLPGPTAPSLP